MLDHEGSLETASNSRPSGRGSGRDNEPEPDWRLVHDNLIRLSAEAGRLDWEIGRELLRAVRARCHLRLGYGSVFEYADRVLGYAHHTTDERLRVARSLERLPLASEALRTGAATWSSVRELTRVATPGTERQWLDAVRDLRVREIENLVRGRRPGDSPDDPPDPEAERHVLRMEVSAETYATFREAMAALRRESDEPLDEDALLMLMARRVLGGPSDEGRGSYQIALSACERCGKTWQEASGELVPVGPEVREKAECDAQHIGSVSGPSPTAPASQTIPPAIRRQVMRRHAGRCAVAGCRHATFVDVHHTEPRSEGGGHDPEKLIVLCSAHHTAVHAGHLLIDGTASAGFSFRHAGGRTYGSRPSGEMADRADSYGKAFGALKRLGFKETEARRALDAVRWSHVGSTPAVEAVLRAALEELTPDLRSTG